MKVLMKVSRTIKTQIWWMVTTVMVMMMVIDVTSLSGPNVCMVKQKYNITKRVKYRAPMAVRTYEWCFAMPPRCSRWNTEMRDVTRLETEERTAEMAVCCPGYKLKDVNCVPICPNGRTGAGCSEECPPNKWGPNCVHECKKCKEGTCDPATGECRCQDGWQGESCEISVTTKAAVAMMEQILTTAKSITSTKMTTQTTPTVTTRSTTIVSTTSTTNSPTTSILPTTERMRITTASTYSATKNNEISKGLTPHSTQKSSVMYKNETIGPFSTITENKNTYKLITEEEIKTYTANNSIYNRTEVPVMTTKVVPAMKAVLATEYTTSSLFTPETSLSITTKPSTTTVTSTNSPRMTIALTTARVTQKDTMKLDTTKRPETTIKQSSTAKFKPKEIWIKPAQKGESPLTESKTKLNQEVPHTKFKDKEISEVTTPKTIIVSIIPTSVSYVTFKRIALTTASTMAQKGKAMSKTYNKAIDREPTKAMSMHTTSMPFTSKVLPSKANTSSIANPVFTQSVTKTKSNTSSTKGAFKTTLLTTQTTNSMSSTLNVANEQLNSSLLSIISSFSTNASKPSQRQSSSETSTRSYVTAPYKKQTFTTGKKATEKQSVSKTFVTVNQRNITIKPVATQTTELPIVTKAILRKQADTNSKRNLTTSNSNTNTVTDDPTKDEETFHILTEPEHITAVMGDKGTERSTIDLISVISIAGGIMMAIITVAVVIVMLERCRRPRYEDVRKYNDIRMQVMIDNNDIPPPYVRSIFHTPLPDPPTIEKCHYQPISTLDRNLKQFMRPVVVQTISPLMLENFRGILECHYDHLPRRSQDMGPMQTRCSVAPSHDERTELLPPRNHSLTDSDIEAMKCEAKMDVIDNTTSEPLYAEIPCWRPPSARAIEVVNLNGEAVTEL